MNETQNNCGNECDDIPPEHLFSDYVEMIYLAVVILIGTPSNVYILIKLFREINRAQSHSVKVCLFVFFVLEMLIRFHCKI